MLLSTKGAAFTAIAACIFIFYSRQDTLLQDTSLSLRESIEWSSIPTKSYNLDTLRDEEQLIAIIEQLLVENRPVIIRDGLCRDWMHRIDWTPQYLTQHIGASYKKVKKQLNDSRFIYFDALPEFPLHPYCKSKFKMLRKIKAHKFWEIGLNETNNKYLYYSYLAPQSIITELTEIGPKPSLFFKSFKEREPNEVKKEDALSISSEIMLWIGFEGIMTTFHYDANINFFQQIKGSKQFHLISPKYWDKMDVFPRLHPSDRQSQIQFDDPLVSSTNSMDSQHAELHREVVFASKLDPDAFQFGILEEGDMLFLPPFWFHEVVTISESYSISVNIWSHSEALTVFQNRILSDALPYAAKYGLSRQELVDSLILFIPRLIEYVMGRPRAKELVCNTLIRSYDVMVENGDINIRWKSVNCRKRYDGPVEYEGIGDIFKSISAEILPIVLLNYVESVIGYLMDPPEVLPFIQQCLCEKSAYW